MRGVPGCARRCGEVEWRFWGGLSRVGTVGSDAFDWRRGTCASTTFTESEPPGGPTPGPGGGRRRRRSMRFRSRLWRLVRFFGGSCVGVLWECCLADRKSNISTRALPNRLLTEPTTHMTTSLLKKKTSPREKNDTDRIRTCDTFVKGFQVLRLNHSATVSPRVKISHWDSNPGSQN